MQNNKNTPTQSQPHLNRLQDFTVALRDYALSQDSKKIFAAIPMVILVGPTAAGRNTLIEILQESGTYKMIVSDTTRARRTNNGILEQTGREYWFKTEQEILDGIHNGDYVEIRIIHNQQVSGANVKEFKDVYEKGLIAIKEIEINGAILYKKYKPDLLCVFLLPPAFDVWMQRLARRGDMTIHELRNRLESAQEEINGALALDYFQFVINNDIHEAAEAVDQLAHGRAVNEAKQELGKAHAHDLLIDIEKFLNA